MTAIPQTVTVQVEVDWQQGGAGDPELWDGLDPHPWWTVKGFVITCPICGTRSDRSLGIKRIETHRTTDGHRIAWTCSPEHAQEWHDRLGPPAPITPTHAEKDDPEP